MKIKETTFDVLKGVGIGVACIVPGVSGGTIAVLLNIYDKMLAAVSNLRKDFKNSVKTLWPIILGIVLGLVGMIYPIKKMFELIPLPTITLFVGMIIGGLPSLFSKVKRKPTATGSVAMIASAAIAIGICFIGSGQPVDLTTTMKWPMYLILVLIGVVGSCALTIPGISGSMLLLILGFWEPILNAVTELIKFSDFGHNFLVLLCFGIGVIIGFFLISKLMTFLLKRFNYLTFMGIIGFILGSLFAIYFTNRADLIPAGSNVGLTVALTIILGLLGLVASGLLTFYAMKAEKSRAKTTIRHNENEGGVKVSFVADKATDEEDETR